MPPRGPHSVVTLVFAAMLLSAGSAQWVIDLKRGERPQVWDLFRRKPSEANLRAFETALEDESWLARTARPWMQYLQFAVLGDLGVKALLGRDGWLFYRPGVEYLTQRAPVDAGSPDAVTAIRDFRDQLAARGIHLVVIPAPNKESIYPGQLVTRSEGHSAGVGRQTQSLLDQLQEAQIEVIDLFALYARESRESGMADGRWYLIQDSHWSPAGLELAARAVADRLLARGWVRSGDAVFASSTVRTQRVGDVVRMLDNPQIGAWFAPEEVAAVQWVNAATQEPYQDDAAAEVLVLGDSFLRIFQADEPGAAGFIAHLAGRLRQPVASIVNDGGASTLVRQELYRRPAFLRHKKVVVWEFVERDIRLGVEGWQWVPLPEDVR